MKRLMDWMMGRGQAGKTPRKTPVACELGWSKKTVVCLFFPLLLSACNASISSGVSTTGAHAGIGIWQGVVSKLDAPILPHMGWNTVEAATTSTLFSGVEGESFYFVHSYAAKQAVGTTQAWSTHGEKFLAAVEDGYISATQFHPEKSGAAGLALIKNWVGSL